MSIASQQDAYLLAALGVFFVLSCGGGLLLTSRRGWFKPRYRDVRITERENPHQYSFGIVGYLFGILMGAIFFFMGIFWTPL
jgi:hypothetical protein